MEIVVIIIVGLVVFGGTAKLSGIGKALGKSIKDFRNEIKDDKPASGSAPAGSAPANTDGDSKGTDGEDGGKSS
jgi:sec-independent protein translocase protein TatA